MHFLTWWKTDRKVKNLFRVFLDKKSTFDSRNEKNKKERYEGQKISPLRFQRNSNSSYQKLFQIFFSSFLSSNFFPVSLQKTLFDSIWIQFSKSSPFLLSHRIKLFSYPPGFFSRVSLRTRRKSLTNVLDTINMLDTNLVQIIRTEPSINFADSVIQCSLSGNVWTHRNYSKLLSNVRGSIKCNFYVARRCNEFTVFSTAHSILCLFNIFFYKTNLFRRNNSESLPSEFQYFLSREFLFSWIFLARCVSWIVRDH